MNKNTDAFNALERLKEGNKIYLNSATGVGDVSPSKRLDTSKNGQHPYAVIVSCSDSRVIPESIFSAGIGELFVIRAAGNTIDTTQLGSIEYAVEHLGCPLVLVLGHTKCGAVDAAINHSPTGFVKFITDEIRLAVGDEKDDIKACALNVQRSVNRIKERLKTDELTIAGGIYNIENGKVEFLNY